MATTEFMKAFSLEGKSALISGASRGIGYEIARTFCLAGASVTLMARPSDDLEDKTNKLLQEGFQASSLGLDLSEPSSISKTLSHLDAFDILVCSAGIAKHAPFLEVNAEQYYDVMRLNLDAAFWLSQACARKMVAHNKPGSIIFISSQMGHVGGALRSVYCASKHALEGMTKAMAIELGPHQIRVNTVAPTFIETALTKSTLSDPAVRDAITSKIKLGRLGVPSDVAYACCYLAADVASMITGTSLIVDGGWTAD